jgi:hypothetical protein
MLPKPLLFFAMPLLLASGGFADTYRFTILNPSVPNYKLGWPVAINNRGHVLFNGVNNTTGAPDAAFLQGKHGLTRVTFPGVQPDAVFGTALSTDDTVGGSLVPANQSGVVSFELSDEGNLRILPRVPAGSTSFYGMNDRGDFTTSGIYNTAVEQPYFFMNGTYFPIQYPGVTSYAASGITNDDTVVGTLLDLQAGYTLRNGVFTLFYFPGAKGTHANCISSKGRFIGGDYFLGREDEHSYVRNSRGEFTTLEFHPPQTVNVGHGLETLQHFSTDITGINDKGQVCGLCVARYGNTTATDVVQFGFIGDPHGA